MQNSNVKDRLSGREVHDNQDLLRTEQRLIRRREFLAHRLALAKAAQQQLLVQAADLVARVQEAEEKAEEIIVQASAPVARKLAVKLRQFDEALLYTHQKSDLAARKTELILTLLARQNVRLQWLESRKKLQRPMASMQRSGTRTCSSTLVNLRRRRISQADVARLRDGAPSR